MKIRLDKLIGNDNPMVVLKILCKVQLPDNRKMSSSGCRPSWLAAFPLLKSNFNPVAEVN